MLNQFTHEQFIALLKNATLSDIEAMAVESLPDGIEMDILFEAPMELSDALRKLVLQAQALQSQNKESSILKALGERGEAILATSNLPNPTPIQQAFEKQQNAISDLKSKLVLKEDPIAKNILNKLLTQFEQSSKQIRSQKSQTEHYLKDVEVVLNDQSQANLHASIENIKDKLQKQITSLNKDIASISQAQDSATQQQIIELKNKLKTLFLNTKKLEDHIPKSKKSTPNIQQDVKQALALTIESVKSISHTSLTTNLNTMLNDLAIDPNTQDPDIKKQMNNALNIIQWFCATNEAVIDLERRIKILPKKDPFIEEQLSKQQGILHALEKTFANSKHFHLSAVQAKQAWTDELKTTL